MRALALVFLGLAVAAAVVVADPARGFDHGIHDGKVVVSGGAALPCAQCHPLTARGALVGRPGHSACFGACHGPTPTAAVPGVVDRRAVCTTCHDDASLATRRPTVSYPPYAVDADFGLTFGHARHATDATCTTCHAPPGARAVAAAPHARCVGCHTAAAEPRMTACAGCHSAGFGANLSPGLVARELAVGATYDHGRHTRRAPRADALACASCHRELAATDELALPAPTVAACNGAGCHDGAAAFATTDSCTRCHTRPPSTPFVVARPSARFDHVAHTARAPAATCASCHRVDGDREVVTAGHAACAGCHAADFGAREPTICGACHAATEPWRHLVVDRPPPPSSAFGVELSHARHAALACTNCHNHDTATVELRPARGHAACADAGCHGGAKGPAPALTACGACHVVDGQAARERSRTAAPWSTRARFRHAPHRTDGDAPLACERCHQDVRAAERVDAIAGPPKDACASCHDGAVAFRMTGHGCARCHGR